MQFPVPDLLIVKGDVLPDGCLGSLSNQQSCMAVGVKSRFKAETRNFLRLVSKPSISPPNFRSLIQVRLSEKTLPRS